LARGLGVPSSVKHKLPAAKGAWLSSVALDAQSGGSEKVIHQRVVPRVLKEARRKLQTDASSTSKSNSKTLSVMAFALRDLCGTLLRIGCDCHSLHAAVEASISRQMLWAVMNVNCRSLTPAQLGLDRHARRHDELSGVHERGHPSSTPTAVGVKSRLVIDPLHEQVGFFSLPVLQGLDG
jgi:hypothetical protein